MRVMFIIIYILGIRCADKQIGCKTVELYRQREINQFFNMKL